MLSVTDKKPKVLRTAAQLLTDLDLGGREYPSNPAQLSEADEEALHIEWVSTASKTGESFAAFLKRRLGL